MFEIIKKYKWSWIVEVIISFIVFELGLKVFLIYAFIRIMIDIAIRTDNLRKLIRVFQVANETKIMAIIKKLNITDKEIVDIYEEGDRNLTKEQRNSFEKDFEDLSRH